MNEYKVSYQTIKSVEVEITWVSVNHPSEPFFRKEVSYKTWLSVDGYATDLDVCEEVFRLTNTSEVFRGRLAKFAPADRGHTAISVGDFVSVNGNVYECADFGWRVVSKKDQAVNA
jgi:hypothetical protein